MRLANIEKSNLVELVEERILEGIRKNHLQVGDKLPSELELTTELGVSRPVVREAISRLRMLGLLDSKKKRGLVVSEPDLFGSMARVLQSSVLGESAKEDLFEFRLMLEIGLADFVYERQREEDLQELWDIVEGDEQAKSRTAKVQWDVRFHKKLYSMASNEMLNQFQDILEPFFHSTTMENKKAGRVTHRKIVEVLSEGTAEDFRNVMYRHLEVHLQGMKLKRE